MKIHSQYILFALTYSVSNASSIQLSDREISLLGESTYDSILDFIPQQGQNLFSDQDSMSSTFDSPSGSNGAFNLRNFGSGSGLVLLNGRRLVSHPISHNELNNFTYMAMTSVNSNIIPLFALSMIKITSPGTSVLFGGGNSTGVINHVLKNNIEGFTTSFKLDYYPNFGTTNKSFGASYGSSSSKSKWGVMGQYYQQERIPAALDSRWKDSDYRRLLPSSSPWAGSTKFRNNSTNTIYGQFDMSGSTNFTDSAGEFQLFLLEDDHCNQDDAVVTGFGTCIVPDTPGLRYNLWGVTDHTARLDKVQLYAYWDHETSPNSNHHVEMLYSYLDHNKSRNSPHAFSSNKHKVGANNFWLNQIPGLQNTELSIDNYRLTEKNRVSDIAQHNLRALYVTQGKVFDNWNYESGIMYNTAIVDNEDCNNVSNNLLKDALFDNTAAAYNPFSAGINSNIDRVSVSAFQKSQSSLASLDYKITSPTFTLANIGSLSMEHKVSFLYESLSDKHDPRTNGTIPYTNFDGTTFPYVSDIVNIRTHQNIDADRTTVQAASHLKLIPSSNLHINLFGAYNIISDGSNGSAYTGEIAYYPIDALKIFGSYAKDFSPPSLSQKYMKSTRTKLRSDFALTYINDKSGSSFDDTYSIPVHQYENTGLNNEEIDIFTVGTKIHFTPNISLSGAYWSWDGKNLFGKFSEENHALYDLLLRLRHGNQDCSNVSGSPYISRAVETDDNNHFSNANMCPFGEITALQDNIDNIIQREKIGYDFGLQAQLPTVRRGIFDIQLYASYISKDFYSGDLYAEDVINAIKTGEIPSTYPINGVGDNLGKDGQYQSKLGALASWEFNSLKTALIYKYIGEFYQSSLTLASGNRYIIPAMETVDVRFTKATEKYSLSIHFHNLLNQRAPLADKYYGYYSEVHNDYGRYISLEYSLSPSV